MLGTATYKQRLVLSKKLKTDFFNRILSKESAGILLRQLQPKTKVKSTTNEVDKGVFSKNLLTSLLNNQT